MNYSNLNKVKAYWEKSTPMNFGVEKWTYEQKRKFRYDLQDYMGRAFNYPMWQGKKVLEIGCGSGIDACEFARWGAVVTAVDITKNAVTLTRELAKEANLKIDAQLYDGFHLPFGTETFDLVFSFGVLHHVPHVSSLMDEIWRVLKFGGKVNAMLYNKDSLLFAYSILHQHILNNSNQAMRSLMDDNVLLQTSNYSERNEGCPYTKAYTPAEAKELFESLFADVSVTAYYNVIDVQGERKVKLNLDDKYGLGWHLVVKGTK